MMRNKLQENQISVKENEKSRESSSEILYTLWIQTWRWKKLMSSFRKNMRTLTQTKSFPKSMKTKSTVHAVDKEYYSDKGDEHYAGSIKMESHVKSLDHEQLKWTETILANDKPIQFQLNRAAMCNIMPSNLLRTVNKYIKLRITRHTLTSYSGHTIIPKSVTTLMCQVNDRKQNS